MTYASGGLIQATDYNTFVTSVNNLWGVGSGDTGYGQSTTVATVAAANVVTATQWSTLISRINSISQQQTGSATALSIPTTGNTISYLSALSSTISTLTTNRLNFVAQGTLTNTTITNATDWIASTTKEATITFANVNAMRAFFNAGGEITFSGASSILTGNSKSTDWDTLLSNAGTVRIRAQTSATVGSTGVPTVNNTGLGFHNLTSIYQTVFKLFSPTSGGYYNLNYVQYDVKLNTAPSTATVMTVKMLGTDAAQDIGVLDNVTGTVNFVVGVTPPSTTYLTNSWGTPAVATLTNTQS